MKKGLKIISTLLIVCAWNVSALADNAAPQKMGIPAVVLFGMPYACKQNHPDVGAKMDAAVARQEQLLYRKEGKAWRILARVPRTEKLDEKELQGGINRARQEALAPHNMACMQKHLQLDQAQCHLQAEFLLQYDPEMETSADGRKQVAQIWKNLNVSDEQRRQMNRATKEAAQTCADFN